jgi:excisionase family DNA binding protein
MSLASTGTHWRLRDLKMTQPSALSIIEAARTLGIGRSTIYRLIGEGRLPIRKIGRRTLILRSDIDTFIEALPNNAS